MGSKTKQSGRVDILVRMSPELKARVIAAAQEDDATTNDWLLDGIEQALDAGDAEVAANKNKADLEQRREMKYEEIVQFLAGQSEVGDVSKLSADQRIDLDEAANIAIEKWRSHSSSNYHAEPRTPLDRLCKEFSDVEDEISGGAHPANKPFEIDIDDLEFDDED